MCDEILTKASGSSQQLLEVKRVLTMGGRGLSFWCTGERGLALLGSRRFSNSMFPSEPSGERLLFSSACDVHHHLVTPLLQELSSLFELWKGGDKPSVPSVHEDDEGDIFYVAPSEVLLP